MEISISRIRSIESWKYHHDLERCDLTDEYLSNVDFDALHLLLSYLQTELDTINSQLNDVQRIVHLLSKMAEKQLDSHSRHYPN